MYKEKVRNLLYSIFYLGFISGRRFESSENKNLDEYINLRDDIVEKFLDALFS